MELKRIVTDTYTVVVWRCDEDLSLLESDVKLSEVEHCYYQKLTHRKRKQEWLTSRYIIKLELGFEVSTIYSGRKPILEGSQKKISISHSDNFVAVIFSDKICGIDIEYSMRNFERVYKRFLSQKEQQYINGKDIARSWTIKEAAYKMIGREDIDFATMFEITNNKMDTSNYYLVYNNKTYNFIVTDVENYILTFGTI